MSSGHVAVFERCVFKNNHALYEGGAISNYYGTVRARDCVFWGNTCATDGGAIWSIGGNMGVYGCTLVGNSGTPSGAIGLDSITTNDIRIGRCIIAFSDQGLAIDNEYALTDVSNCCVFANAGGDSLCGTYHDNLFVDPLLCDPLGGYTGLCANSACLPAGNPWSELIGASGEACGECTSTDVGADDVARVVLHPPMPNPFEGTTTIRFDVPPRAARVGLRVFNVRGELVKSFNIGSSRGPGSVTWDGRNSLGCPVASGVYFYRVTAVNSGGDE